MKASKVLIGLEIVICLGPVVVMLATGVVLFPMWAFMLLFLATNPEKFVAGSGGVLGVGISIVLSLLGILGVIAIIRLYRLMWQRSPAASSRKVTLALTCAGLVALLSFNVIDGNLGLEAIAARPWIFLFFFALPLICAGHVLYVLRERLFGGVPSP
jgi:hypothetical protein